MKKILIIFMIMAVSCLSCNLSALGNAPYSTAYADEVQTAITADCVIVEYAETVYNGEKQTPDVTVKIDEKTLVKGTDYIVTYPKDTTSAGDKTIIISGKGTYSGKAEATYRINSLDCANTELVTVEVGDCYYNGLPQYPDVTVKYNGFVIPESEYTLSLSDNIEVSADDSATCVVTFRNNCYGERTAYFKVQRALPQDMEIDLVARVGQSFSIDLTGLKPDGGVFGNLVFNSSDFEANAQPRVAFNVLNFTLKSSKSNGTMVGVPVDMPNGSAYDDYWLEFYIDITDKTVPVLSLNPVTKKYDGKAASADGLADNGSIAFADGNVISGKWSFTTDAPVKPCVNEWAVAKFTPDDTQYSHAYGLVPITVVRREIEDFRVKTNSKSLYIGEPLDLTIKGIPNDFDGAFSVTEKNGREFDVLADYFLEDERIIQLELPENNAVYSIVLTLDGSALYAPFSKEVTVTVGTPDEVVEDSPTTLTELTELIENATDLSTVRVNNLTSISADLLRKASAKKLVIENEINDILTIVIEPAEMTSYQSLDLAVNRAVIPPVLLEELGDEELYSFATFTKATSGISVKVNPDFDTEHPFACLYLYNTNGELEYLQTATINGNAVKFALPSSGKFVITTSHYSHIKCDVNNDGKFSTSDLMETLNIFVSISGQPTKEQLSLIDFNKDGKIGTSDLKYILEYYTSV